MICDFIYLLDDRDKLDDLVIACNHCHQIILFGEREAMLIWKMYLKYFYVLGYDIYIINEEDTISVVTKQGSEYINNIKDIKHDIVSNISGIETTEVIESIDILKDYGEVVDDVKLNKDCVNAVNDIYVTEQKFASCINEKIKGNLEFVRNGIMLINDDGELTIYSTNKISSINK